MSVTQKFAPQPILVFSSAVAFALLGEDVL